MDKRKIFIRYIRTRQFYEFRLIGDSNNPNLPVYISDEEIEERFFPSNRYDKELEIKMLVESGRIAIYKNGRYTMYQVLQNCRPNIRMLKPKRIEYDDDTQSLKKFLDFISFEKGTEVSPYIENFFKHRRGFSEEKVFNETIDYFTEEDDFEIQEYRIKKDKFIEHFFLVDNFSGRIHNPVCGLNKETKANILIHGDQTVSLDIKQLHPLILGKILQEKIGDNEFSTWINEGQDFYTILQERANLPDREAAKDYFNKFTFSRPGKALELIFGRSYWVRWINQYKSRKVPENNSGIEYSNLAWLLQTQEVAIMRKIWHKMIQSYLVFCTAYDEIIINKDYVPEAKEIMRSVLKESFEYFEIVVTNKFTMELKDHKDLIDTYINETDRINEKFIAKVISEKQYHFHFKVFYYRLKAVNIDIHEFPYLTKQVPWGVNLNIDIP